MFHNFSKINIGIYMMSAVFFSISFHSFFANITVQPTLYLAQVIIISSNIYIMVNWIIALDGFNNKNVFESKLALILWSIYIILWFGAVIISVIFHGKLFVCSGCRCPESMWLFSNPGHNYSSFTLDGDYSLDYDYSIKPIMVAPTTVTDDDDGPEKRPEQPQNPGSTTETVNKPYKSGDIILISSFSTPILRNDEIAWMTEQPTYIPNFPSGDSKSKNKTSRIYPKRSMNQNVFVILVFICMLGILVYGWLVIYSSCYIKTYAVHESK